MKYWRPVYYGLAGFWLLAGLATGRRLCFVLFASQLLVSLVALAMNLWAALSFRFRQELSVSRTAHGQPVHLFLTIHNEQPVPYPLMKIRLETPGWREQRTLQFNLASTSHLDFDLVLACPYRGSYPIGMTVIDFIDIFNLVRLPFDMRLLPYYRQPELLVYPALDPLDHLPLAVPARKAFARQNFATEDLSEPFSTVRSYRPGDSRRLIHWKASLRQQILLTRQFDQSAEPGVLAVLDLRQPPWPGEACLQAGDALCQAAASLIHYLLSQNQPLSLVSLGQGRDTRADSGLPAGGAASRGLRDFQRYFDWLAAVPFGDPAAPPAQAAGTDPLVRQLALLAADRSDSRPLLVLTTRLDPALIPLVMQIRQHGRSVTFLLAGPRSGADRNLVVSQMASLEQYRRLGLAVWPTHYGDNLQETIAPARGREQGRTRHGR